MVSIELSPKKIIPGALTVWNEPGPEVDVVMDLKNLTFRPGTVSKIYSFHVADHLFPGEAQEAIKNWADCLAKGGELYIVVDDFQYLARAFVGGDLTIEKFNQDHSCPNHCTSDNLLPLMLRAGFKDDKVAMWYDMPSGTFVRQHFEMVMAGTK